VCTILRDVADAVPERVAIDNVQTSDRLHPRVTVEGTPEGQDRPGVTISGVAASNTLVGEFMARLGRAPSFQETFLSYAQQNNVEGRMQYSFEIIAICSEGA
jgi:Tfp pilus assembly protein PilN